MHRGRGAVSWSYPSIVGSGPNATILHYPEDDRQMQAGELLLVDAACNYGYMSGDITRTYPVSGTFTPPRKTSTRIVLQAQDEAMKVARAGTPLQEVHDQDRRGDQGRTAEARPDYRCAGDQYRHVVHARRVPLHRHRRARRRRTHPCRSQPGMAFVIEPGIYIRQSALDALPTHARESSRSSTRFNRR